MTFRSEVDECRRALISLELRINETKVKLDSEYAESKYYMDIGGYRNKQRSLKHFMKAKALEAYLTQLLDVLEGYKKRTKTLIGNFYDTESQAFWWDAFMCKMPTKALADKYSMSERDVARKKKKMKGDAGNDGRYCEIDIDSEVSEDEGIDLD